MLRTRFRGNDSPFPPCQNTLVLELIRLGEQIAKKEVDKEGRAVGLEGGARPLTKGDGAHHSSKEEGPGPHGSDGG